MDLNTLTKLLNIPGYKVVEVIPMTEEKLCQINKPIYKAMLLKESFLEVYSCKDEKEGEECLKRWIKQAFSSGLRSFIELGHKFIEKMRYILN